jgi:hypothetical protein
VSDFVNNWTVGELARILAEESDGWYWDMLTLEEQRPYINYISALINQGVFDVKAPGQIPESWS